jgi:hypothetical protein
MYQRDAEEDTDKFKRRITGNGVTGSNETIPGKKIDLNDTNENMRQYYDPFWKVHVATGRRTKIIWVENVCIRQLVDVVRLTNVNGGSDDGAVKNQKKLEEMKVSDTQGGTTLRRGRMGYLSVLPKERVREE